MNLNIGDFIISKHSINPSLIIKKIEDSYLISITEYDGDYKLIPKTDAIFANLDASQELSILSKFGQWFYNEHKIIYQEIIIKHFIFYNFSIFSQKII